MELVQVFNNPPIYAGKCPVCNEPIFVEGGMIKIHVIKMVDGFTTKCSGSERAVTNTSISTFASTPQLKRWDGFDNWHKNTCTRVTNAMREATDMCSCGLDVQIRRFMFGYATTEPLDAEDPLVTARAILAGVLSIKMPASVRQVCRAYVDLRAQATSKD